MEIDKVYNENCLETMSRMGDKLVPLTITSPPYDNLRSYNGYSFDFESVAKELYRVTTDGGVVVWVVGDATINGSESGTSFRQALYFMQCGFNLHDTMIYHSDKPPLTHNRYEQCFEYMFIFSKGKPRVFTPIKIPTLTNGERKYRAFGKLEGAKKDKNSAIRYRPENTYVSDEKIKSNIWHYATGYGGSTTDKIAFQHPAIFPEQLANDHIISWSNEGDLIYDCFMGSGTTAKMAIINKRHFIGSELSKEYYDLINKRISITLQSPTLF